MMTPFPMPTPRARTQLRSTGTHLQPMSETFISCECLSEFRLITGFILSVDGRAYISLATSSIKKIYTSKKILMHGP